MTSAIINGANNKFAIIIGINYTGSSVQLSGCINDAKNIKTFLIEKGKYSPENIIMYTDDNPSFVPTKQNILNAFNLLITKANSGFNELWFSYSGHGFYVSDVNGDEADRKDEVICPIDYASNGMITDDFIYTNLVSKLPSTSTLFSLMDCCHSGTIFDLPYLYIISSTTNNSKNSHVANIISISGSRDDQTSADAYINDTFQGAMTWSFLSVMSAYNYNIVLLDLLKEMRNLLVNQYTQVPLLAVSNIDSYDRFLMKDDSIVPLPTGTTKSVTFTMTVDTWYGESTWNVWSIAENKYIFPFDNKFTKVMETTIVTKELASGTYKLVLKDAYGDGGISYKVSINVANIINGKMPLSTHAEYAFTI